MDEGLVHEKSIPGSLFVTFTSTWILLVHVNKNICRLTV